MLTSSSEGPEEEPEMLLKALARLEERTPGRYRLTIVGDGQLENELRAEADRFGDAVRFRGHVPNGPELFELYRASDVFVHVARTEGLPQVLTEAQATGLPIVATDVRGVRAGLGDSAEALLAPASGQTPYVEDTRSEDVPYSCHIRAVGTKQIL